MHDYFDILGVPGDAPASEVRRWSARRVRQTHPDFSDSGAGLKPALLPAPTPLHLDTAVDFAEMAHVRVRMLAAFFACAEHDTELG